MDDHDGDRWLDLLQQAAVLKTTPRTGWHLRGVPEPESVADHTFATALVALVLAEQAAEPVDLAKLLLMALLHDLAETVVGDIPRRGARLLPDGAKAAAESAALTEILDGLPVSDRWQDLLAEYKDGTSPEARLVKAADRLEFLVQALGYREATGTLRLEDIREGAARGEPDEPAAARAIREAVRRRWPG